MPDYFNSPPRGWLAFELSILRRLRFRFAHKPFRGRADLETHVNAERPRLDKRCDALRLD